MWGGAQVKEDSGRGQGYIENFMICSQLAMQLKAKVGDGPDGAR